MVFFENQSIFSIFGGGGKIAPGVEKIAPVYGTCSLCQVQNLKGGLACFADYIGLI